MSDVAWLILLVVVALGAWLFWPRQPKIRRVSFEAPRAPTKLKSDMTPDEQEVERARRAFEQNDRDRDLARHEHEQATADARGRIERARKYMHDSGLDRIVPALWDQVQHWGSWAAMPDRWTAPSGVTNITGSSEREHPFTAWSWEGRAYRIELQRSPNYTSGYASFGTIHLAVDGEPVLALPCSENDDTYSRNWRTTGVDMLKVGPWMADVIRCAGHIRLSTEQEALRRVARMNQEQASRIDFGES